MVNYDELKTQLRISSPEQPCGKKFSELFNTEFNVDICVVEVGLTDYLVDCALHHWCFDCTGWWTLLVDVYWSLVPLESTISGLDP